MTMATVHMYRVATTKNTYRFEELDERGAPLENPQFNPYAKVGVLYVKQKTFNNGGQSPAPERITVTIETV